MDDAASLGTDRGGGPSSPLLEFGWCGAQAERYERVIPRAQSSLD